MAEEKLLIDKISFCESLCYPKSEELTNVLLDTNWKINLSFYNSFEVIKKLPFLRRVQRARIIIKCEKLPRRALLKGEIMISDGILRSENGGLAEHFEKLFEEGENSHAVDIKVRDGEFVTKIVKISGELKFYASTENYFYFKFGGTFRPSISDLEESRFEILNQLGKDLYSLYRDQQFSDVSLHCNSEVFKAHKNVLSARSKVFSAMFQNPMKESEASVVEIEDMSSDVLQTLLEFIYGGKIRHLSDTKACDLLAAAEKYDLKDLKRSMLLYLQSVLSVDNVLCILSFAEMYDENLKKVCVDFICKEFHHLKNTEEWKKFQNDKAFLANEVLYNMIDFVNCHDSKEHQSTT